MDIKAESERRTRELKEALIEAVYDALGGDSDWDLEGGFHPVRKQAEEVVNDAVMPNIASQGMGWVSKRRIA